MSEFINRPCIREQCEPRERGLDYSSIMSNRVKQVSSPPRYQRYIEPPSPNNRTLSRFDCYLGFLFMTKALIYDRIRGIMIAKKFMESLNYVNVIIHFPKTRCIDVSNRFFWQRLLRSELTSYRDGNYFVARVVIPFILLSISILAI